VVRVVLDTNVVVSAYLVPTGKPARILSLARQGKIDICLSEDILGEIKRTLLRPKLQKIHKATPQEVDRFLRAFTEVVNLVPGTMEVDEVNADPDDNKVLACALEGEADFIVSGDHHLTDIVSFRGIPIVKPDAFLGIIAGQS
jgi:putative PIN family toxin of toxin-antitoxin system